MINSDLIITFQLANDGLVEEIREPELEFLSRISSIHFSRSSSNKYFLIRFVFE